MEERLLNAAEDHSKGYNCAQSVLNQFCAELGLETEQALLLASGFGGGMRIGSVCGAVTGGIMALGLAFGFTDPEHKAAIDAPALELIERFRIAIGCIDCRDIVGIDTCDPVQRLSAAERGVYADKCPNAIETSVQIVHEILNRLKVTS